MSPEEKARLIIDKKLIEAGWVLQDRNEFNPTAGVGVAVREFKTNDNDEVDYALFVDKFPVGLVEAKPEESGVHLSTKACEQNMRYVKSGLKGNYDKNELRFIYEATNLITEFTDLRDPKPRLRRVYTFHRPEYLKELILDHKINQETLRGRMQHFPELPYGGFRDCQIAAITNLEKSFAQNNPRALIQMATGAGKTYTAITSTYRLLKFAKARRVLFLVDTKNLGAQAEMEYTNYQPYDNTDKLKDIYNIRRIQMSNIPQDTKICISTIQRLYSMLQGEIAKFADNSDEEPGATGSEREIKYNKEYPPEFFDVIIIDECHRSIYNLWRQVLEYFDAFLVGLTATPNKYTYAFFNQNVVSEYTHEQAINDRVNVGAFGTFIIDTEKTKQGGKVAPINQKVEVRDIRTRKQKWETADDDISYDGNDLDRAIVNKSQIRLVLQTFKDNWHKWAYFRDRSENELPKTLIFAKTDSHAADIVEIAKEVFGEGNDFCKKITYTSEEDENALLYAYRNEYNPRIAVTVSKIATGTDVKAIEILLFMRDIRSENYYEQMLGRARRTLSHEELIKASPSARSAKLGYVIVDAVGVTKSKKSVGKGGTDFKPTVSFKQLLDSIVTGDVSSENFITLGTRLDRLDATLTDKEKKQFKELAGGVPLHALAVAMKNAHDADMINHAIRAKCNGFDSLSVGEQENIKKDVIKERCTNAAKPLYDPKVRKFLLSVRGTNEQTIDPALDSLLNAGFDEDIQRNNERTCTTFKDFINKYKDEITALQIIYNQDYRTRHLTETMIIELYDKMKAYSPYLERNLVFAAYEGRTKKKTVFRELMDIVQLVRLEYGQVTEPVSFADRVRDNFRKWIFSKNANKRGERGIGVNPFSAEQHKWLDMIKEYIAINAYFAPDSLESGVFKQNGGAMRYCRLFGDKWEMIINELNTALAA